MSDGSGIRAAVRGLPARSPRTVGASLAPFVIFMDPIAERIMTDPELIRQFLRYQGDFMAYLMAMVRDLDAAEEVFQNAAVVVMQHAGSSGAEQIRDFRAWAKEIVRRQALQYLRSKGRAARVAEIEPELLVQIDRAFDDDATDPAFRQRELDALRECATRLPDVQRRMVAMRYEGRAPFDVIGAAVGRTAAAVQRSLSRTRRMLHDCVQSKLARGSGMAP